MMKILITIALCALVVAACAPDQQTITVGGIHTLSGNLADVLGGSADGVRLAVDDFQKETGTAVRLIEEDDKSCSDKTGGANKLIGIDGVQAIVGTTCSSMTLAIAPLAQQSKTILASGVSTSKSITESGEYVFRTIPSDASKSVKIAQEIIDRGHSRAGFIYANGNDAIVDGIHDVQKNLPAGSVIANEAVVDDESDFRTVLLKVMSEKPDVLVLSFSDSRQFGLVMRQYDELGLPRIPIYVPIETVENPLVIQVGGKSVEGLLYPAYALPSGPEYAAFASEYRERYGKEVPPYAAETYDATMITLKAIARSDGTREDVVRQMHAIGNEYPGVSGTITFDEHGDVHKPLVMKTIANGTFVELP